MYLTIKNTLSAALLLLLMTTSSSMALKANEIDHIYYFGDSLFDTGYMDHSEGFLPDGQSPIYTTPHGHVAPYYLSRAFNQPLQANDVDPLPTPPTTPWTDGALTGNDYAAGGAVTSGEGIGFEHYRPPALDYQISHFLATHDPQANPNDVYFIWAGSNDILKTFLTYKSEPAKIISEMDKAIDAGTDTLKNEVKILYDAGARHIYVLNLPPMGDTPLMNKSALFKTIGNQVSEQFNAALIVKLASLHEDGIENTPVVNIYQLLTDITTEIDTKHIYTEPGTALTLTDDSDPACLDSVESSLALAINCKNWVPEAKQQQYLFADNVHPTDTAHQILAIHLEQFLKSQK
ncbi:MAG: hypothetical protein COB66_07255 [Coxiella sp. (in: Bacteria)]|nr:MAG: hypothetical protein COB66_07255 [Coxiella sp. (in: g-proteobacteria)]